MSDQHRLRAQFVPDSVPGFRDAAIYPLGGPDLTTARHLAGGGRRRGVLYTCDTLDCDAHAEIVRANLAAIGIELEIRRFSFGVMFSRVIKPDEPFDLSIFGWIGETPDPSEFVDVMFDAFAPPTRFLERTPPVGPRIRAATKLTGPNRSETYAALDREIMADEAPFAPQTRPPLTSSPPGWAARPRIRSTASTSRRCACAERPLDRRPHVAASKRGKNASDRSNHPPLLGTTTHSWPALRPFPPRQPTASPNVEMWRIAAADMNRALQPRLRLGGPSRLCTRRGAGPGRPGLRGTAESWKERLAASTRWGVCAASTPTSQPARMKRTHPSHDEHRRREPVERAVRTPWTRLRPTCPSANTTRGRPKPRGDV